MTTDVRAVAESYDRVAPAFAAVADQQVYRHLALPLVTAIRSAGVDDRGVLDVAAGTGAVGRFFDRAIALDASVQQLRRNDARNRVCGDFTRLPFRDGAFSAAICGFGVNHTATPRQLVAEMARVAPTVGLSTWRRPEPDYPAKQAVAEVFTRRMGRTRSDTGELLDRYTEAVGSVEALVEIIGSAGLEADAEVVTVEIPWPGLEAFVDYRMSLPTCPAPPDDVRLRAEAVEALAALPPAAMIWHAQVIVGVGRR